MNTTPISFFVSSHGFGHAARSAAVMEALYENCPTARFSIFTGVPRWFFEDSITAPFEYFNCLTDVGFVQTTPMEEDLSATLGALSAFLPLRQETISQVSAEVRRSGCRLVVSDISPLGLAVAADLDLPSALIENFTWDWIYRAYVEVEPRFGPFIAQLHDVYRSPPLRIQAEPFCETVAGAARVAPISRSIRQSPREIRQRLKAPEEPPLVLLTMGGFPTGYHFLERLQRYPEVTFVIPGTADAAHRERNLILLPHRTGFRHADLVAAADLVVGKLGYSTLAEVFQAATPYLFIQRPRFPESPPLARFARNRLVCDEITETELEAASWPSRLSDLKAHRPASSNESAGSQQAAELLLDMLDNR